MRKKITDILKTGKILISDGAWGTILQQKGLQAGECPELWNITHPEAVRAIAESYIQAGADLIETNSFGGSSFKLEHFGLTERVTELNEAAARLSREAAGDDKWVAGSIGPTGKMLVMGDVTEEELYDAFKAQSIALEKGGADAACIETMSDIDEAVIAIRATKENTNMEVICTFTFNAAGENDFYTMMGVTPAQAAEAAQAAGADIIGSNCGNGIKNMIKIVEQLHEAAPGIPIMVQANAGLPEIKDGQTVFPESPEQMANLVPELIRAGANIIGGCCGTTPAHIEAIYKAKKGQKGALEYTQELLEQSEFKIFKYSFREVTPTFEEISSFLKINPSETEHPANIFIHEILNELHNNEGIAGGYKILPIENLNVKEGGIILNNTELNPGRQVCTYLRNSEFAALFLCTAGSVFTELTQQFNSRGDRLEAYIIDAIGSLTVENAMDKIQSELESAMNGQDLRITNRYSPGYCNWPVFGQKELFALLGETPVTVFLNENCLMTPLKSVSGLIGIGKNVRKSEYACAVCHDKNCIYKSILKNRQN